MKQFFPKNFHHFSPRTSFWPPKQHFLSILDQFWQISAFYSTVTSKLPPYHKGDCLYNTQEVILKQFFPKFFTILALWRHFDPPKTALFEHFWQFFYRFQTSTITWKLPNQTMVVIVPYTQVISLKQFSQNFWPNSSF